MSNESGKKYLREIVGLRDGKADVYTVIEIFDVRCPALQHGLKKVLCAGARGKNPCIEDLIEARDAMTRAIELQQDRESRQANYAEAAVKTSH